MSDQPETTAPVQEDQPKDAADAQQKTATEEQNAAPEGGVEEKEPTGAEGGAEEKKEPAGAEGETAEEKKEGEQAQVTEQKEGIPCTHTCEVRVLLEPCNVYLQERRQRELPNPSPRSDLSLCVLLKWTPRSSTQGNSHDEVSSKGRTPSPTPTPNMHSNSLHVPIDSQAYLHAVSCRADRSASVPIWRGSMWRAICSLNVMCALSCGGVGQIAPAAVVWVTYLTTCSEQLDEGFAMSWPFCVLVWVELESCSLQA